MNTKYTQMSASSIENAQTSIGMRLRLFLRLRNWSIKQFSKETGIPYRSLQNYLSDERKPNAEHLEKLFNIGLDPTWVISGGAKKSIFGDLKNGNLINNENDTFGVVLADSESYSIIQSKIVSLVDEVQKDIFEKEKCVIGFNLLFYVYLYAMQLSLAIISKLSVDILELRKNATLEYIYDLIIWPVVLEKLKAKFNNMAALEISSGASAIKK